MAGLFGEYRYKVDAKGRLSLPAQIRKTLTEDTDLVVVGKGEVDKLSVYTVEAFEDWKTSLFEKRGGFDPNDRKHVQLETLLNASAMPCSMDSVGRISLTQTQREAAGIDKDVTVIGNTDHFEIWDTQRWQEFQSSVNLDDLLFG